MTEPRNFDEIDQKLSSAMQVTAPAPEFISSLWTRIENQPLRPESRPAFLPSLGRMRRWSFAAVSLILFLVTFLAIGPSRVMAALQAFLKYIPGIGYVDDSSALRIVKPFEQTIGSVSILIPAGVVDGEKTVIRYTLTGIEMPLIDLQNLETLCIERPFLRLPDGGQLASQGGEAGTSDRKAVEGRETFAAVPNGVDSFELVFPCLIHTEKKVLDNAIVLPLQLESMPPDYPAYQVLELPTPQPAPALPAEPEMGEPLPASPVTHGIQFSVKRMAEMPDGYLFEGSLAWPADEFNFVNLWPFDIKVTDAGGREVQIEEAPEQSQIAIYQEGKIGWAVRTNRKDFAFPLTFKLAKVNISQLTLEPAFEIDLGDNPQIGESWELDYRHEVVGLPVKISRAAIARLPGGFTQDLYLNVEGESPLGNDVSLSFSLATASKFPSCLSQSGGGGGGGGGGMDSSGNGGTFTTMVFLGCHPQGRIAVELRGVSYDLAGEWSAVVDLPFTGNGTKMP